MRDSIKLYNAALDEQKEEIVLRGVLDPTSLAALKVGEYQREILPLSKIQDLAEAFKAGASVPDIDLGMRGGGYIERDGAFYLQDDVYIVDGLQRRTAALQIIKAGGAPRLGAIVHFNTTEAWERERFRILNVARVKLSPNVLLRNMRSESPSLELLWQLCHETDFVLHGRVCWEQRMHREHLITALTLLRSACSLHSGFGPAHFASRHDELAVALDRTLGKISRKAIRHNVREFWQLLDECWKVRVVHFKEGATYLRMTFLTVLAKILADHENFWHDSNLFVESALKRKLSLFPISDPQVVNLASAAGPSRNILYAYMRDHINSGKRTRRLIPIKRATITETDGGSQLAASA